MPDIRCCDVGAEGHAGPCVRICEYCDGFGSCVECGGLGCEYCDGAGKCVGGCDDGEIVQGSP